MYVVSFQIYVLVQLILKIVFFYMIKDLQECKAYTSTTIQLFKNINVENICFLNIVSCNDLLFSQSMAILTI